MPSDNPQYVLHRLRDVRTQNCRLLSSIDNDPLVGEEVKVATTPPSTSVSTLDLSKQIGSVVMLDATGKDSIYAAKLVSVADPLLTALYMSTFLQPPTDSTSPQ
jgi:hypothetical protein